MKEPIFIPLLLTHIVSGCVALFSGMIPIATTKGGEVHRTAGKIFFVAMLFASVSAFIIAIFKSLDFLLAISIFSFYMNYTGYRILKNRTGVYEWYDWIPVVFSCVTIAYMLSRLNIVLGVFGVILGLMTAQDIRLQLKTPGQIKEERRNRVLTHIARMVGTYIATITAFLVVNINFVKPGWLLWLLPTALGTPFILYQQRVWRKKLYAAS